MSDTSKSGLVALSQEKKRAPVTDLSDTAHPSVELPVMNNDTTPSLSARIEAARAAAEPGQLFQVILSTAPVVGLRSIPDVPLTTGGTFWGDGLTPHVIRPVGTLPPLHSAPLVFVVRQGQEEADYHALVAVVQRDGMKHDAPVLQIMYWAGDNGRGQFVAFLPPE